MNHKSYNKLQPALGAGISSYTEEWVKSCFYDLQYISWQFFLSQTFNFRLQGKIFNLEVANRTDPKLKGLCRYLAMLLGSLAMLVGDYRQGACQWKEVENYNSE